MLLKPVITLLLIAVLALAPVIAKNLDADSEDADEETPTENNTSDDQSPCSRDTTPCLVASTPICIVDGKGKFARFLNQCEFERATQCGQVSTILHTLYLCPDRPEVKASPSLQRSVSP